MSTGDNSYHADRSEQTAVTKLESLDWSSLPVVRGEDFEYREDGGLAKKYEVDDLTGWMTVDATIARIGVQEYRNRDGSIRREYRPAEEVSDPDSLKSFRMLPHCLEHPPALLQKENSKQYQVGFTSNDVKYDKGYVKTQIKITDSDAIQDALNGVRVEISCGYTCKLDWTPGVFDGQPYDCIQRKIRGNHTAQVTRGRAGKDVKLHLDSDLSDTTTDVCSDRSTRFSLAESVCLNRLDSDDVVLDFDVANSGIQQDSNLLVSSQRTNRSARKSVLVNKEDTMNVASIKKELSGMSDGEKVSYLLEKLTEIGDMVGELESEKQDALNIAALHEGRAARWKEEIQARGDSAGNGASSEELERLQRRTKEKDIRIDSLTSDLDDLRGQISTLKQQLNTQSAKAERLDSELLQEREAKAKEIVQQRRDWLSGYQRVEKYLPANAKEELNNDPRIADTCPALYRLALQHNRPELKLDNRTDSEVVAMFDMMDAEMQSRRSRTPYGGVIPQSAQSGIADPLRVKVDGAKNYQPQPALGINDIRADQMRKAQEAWQITN